MPEPYYSGHGVELYLGDASEVLPTLGVTDADAVVTDPPFKLSQEYAAGVDPDNLVAVASIWPVFPALLACCRPGAVAAVFYDTRILPLALRAIPTAGWRYLRALNFYRQWGRCSLVHGWMTNSDFILLFQKPGGKAIFHGQPRHDTIIRRAPDGVGRDHPGQKPVDAVGHLVERLCPPGGLVLDPYLGSGTTAAVAAVQGRRCIGIEQEERYLEGAAKRMADL